MQAFTVIIFIITQMAGAPGELVFDHIGQIGEIVVTAPRYEYEDEAWAGLMETVTVTAPRYDGEHAHIAGITDQNKNQSFGRQNIFTSFVQARAHIYLMILGAMLLLIVRFLLPSFLSRSRKRRDEVCYCGNGN